MAKRPRSKKLWAAAVKRRRLQLAANTNSGTFEKLSDADHRGSSGASVAEDATDGGSGWIRGSGNLGAVIDEGLDRFEMYYRRQRLVQTDDEWRKIRNTLRQPMPVAFRLCVGRGQAGDVARAELEKLLADIERDRGLTTARGRYVPPPRRFPFADAVAIGCDQKVLRQEQSDAPHSLLSRLFKWVNKKSAEGLVSRQEIVSAVPVALLDVRSWHTVLDMCASPGSKTLQALEHIGGGHNLTATGHPRDDFAQEERQGVILANEISSSRGHVLARRCLALKGACAHLAVTQHRAQAFPGPLHCFDRIICDVPCSGDAAIRKFPEKWRDWSAYPGRMLHSLQLQIALRAAMLLRVGGIMAYSTCSFNPLEDEAVVAAVLSRTRGALELLQAPSLDGLDLRPGLLSWEVVDDVHGVFRDHADAMARLPKQERRRYRRTMWPPASGTKAGERPPLERCIRLLPHLKNTGGFFVALLRKRALWPPPRSCAPSGTLEAKPLQLLREVPVFKACPVALMQDLEPLLGRLVGAGEKKDQGEHRRRSYSLSMSGRHRIFLFAEALARLVGSRPQPSAKECQHRSLAAVSAGVCVAERPRGDSTRGCEWRLTPAACELLALQAAPSNKRAAAKLCELHLCIACSRRLLSAAFSRKMLTRPPGKRRCAECTTQPL
eukprot:TRINITY_DN26074_c0_g1_i1.p1 TRINITY_DN26074_c0_g1~~TRINITY_DN26074_c0_g1_i1.p1  ORF type:complete len:665 (-),score=93.90 TRINITY_DN26074_c0_g1_i1:325-2319(-)